MREDEFLLTHVYNSVFIQENASSNTDPFPLCGSPQFLVGIQSHPFKAVSRLYLTGHFHYFTYIDISARGILLLVVTYLIYRFEAANLLLS